MSCHLYVSTAVAALEFDLETDGEVELSSNVAVNKILSTNRTGNTLKVLIFGLNQVEFSGLFATVTAPVASIRAVVGARADATDAMASVSRINKVPLVSLVIQ